jgi:L-fucono-1,5-lactonase
MIIDSHQHFWRLDRGDYNWLTPQLAPIYRDFGPTDLAPILTRHGIDGTVLVQAAATVAETDYMLSIAAQCDFVRGVVGWVDFDSPDAAAEIERLAGNPRLKGVRPMFQDIADPDWMLGGALGAAFSALLRRGLRFDALLKPRHLAPFARFLGLYPDLPIVVDHGAKPAIASREFRDWAAAMQVIARDPRVFCKISGLVTEAAPNWRAEDLERYLDLLVESFGPGRLMWGSDWPVVNLAGGYERWREASLNYLARLNRAERGAILGGTAQRFYGL